MKIIDFIYNHKLGIIMILLFILSVFVTIEDTKYKKTLNEYELIMYEAKTIGEKEEARKLIEIIKTRKLLEKDY